MTDESKKETVEEETTAQQDSAEETKSGNQEEDTSQKDEGSEEQDDYTPPTREEYEKLQKKALDFDGLIEKRRLEKFKKKEAPEAEEKKEAKDVDFAKIAEEAARKVFQESYKKDQEANLNQAFKDFVKENDWANNDEIIDKISESFDAGNAISKEDILAKLRNTAKETFPTQYEQALETRIKAKILAEQGNINVGSGGGSSDHKEREEDVNASAEDKRMATKYFGGDIARYLKYKKDN